MFAQNPAQQRAALRNRPRFHTGRRLFAACGLRLIVQAWAQVEGGPCFDSGVFSQSSCHPLPFTEAKTPLRALFPNHSGNDGSVCTNFRLAGNLMKDAAILEKPFGLYPRLTSRYSLVSRTTICAVSVSDKRSGRVLYRDSLPTDVISVCTERRLPSFQKPQFSSG